MSFDEYGRLRARDRIEDTEEYEIIPSELRLVFDECYL